MAQPKDIKITKGNKSLVIINKEEIEEEMTTLGGDEPIMNDKPISTPGVKSGENDPQVTGGAIYTDEDEERDSEEEQKGNETQTEIEAVKRATVKFYLEEDEKFFAPRRERIRELLRKIQKKKKKKK
eukprot:464612_1